MTYRKHFPAALLGMALFIAVGGVLASPAHPVRRATPRDSYLQYKVYSVNQLIQQVSDNAAVRQRFARHFQVPENRVVSYMRANLVESYVPATGRYTVYCVRPSGKFYPVKQTFRQGTKVFALRNGEPVMKWVCGNPLSRFLPAVQVKNSPPPTVRVSPSIQELTPADTVSVLVPSDVVAPIYQPLIPTSVAAASAPIFSGGGVGGRSLLPLLLPVALVGVHSGGGGNSTPPIPPPGPAVPEAGSLAYLAAALPLAFIASRRLRKLPR